MSKKFISVMFIIILTVTSILGSGVFYVISSAGSDVSLYVNPEFLSAEPDQVFTVTISIANVENLLKWSLSVSWDPAVIELDPASASAVTEGDFLKNAGLTLFRVASYTVGSGCLSFISCELIQPTSVSGDGTLLILHFRAVNDGETDIVIGNSVFYNFNKQKILHTCSSGRISVKSVTHDVAVKLEAPSRLILGNSVLLNATVENVGDVDEENVNLAILINGTVETSQTIPLLKVGSSHKLSLSWTPSFKGVYNITAYAAPVIGETKTSNNIDVLLVETVSVVHDVAVSLESPTRLTLGESGWLNATVTNVGTIDEENVTLSIIINGEVKESKLVVSLPVGFSGQLSYLWKPASEGTYNVTAYASPVAGEIYILNNREFTLVNVFNSSAQVRILIVAGDYGSYYYRGTSLPEFEYALQLAGYEYDVWKESVQGHPSLETLLNYRLVIWTCGDYSWKSIDKIDAGTLEEYLRQGGNILVEGENIAYEHPPSYSNLRSDVLNVIYQGYYGVTIQGLEVIDIDSVITQGLPSKIKWTIKPGHVDQITPSEGAYDVLRFFSEEYPEYTNTTAVNVFDGTQKGIGSIVYYAFALFSLPESERCKLVANSIKWLLRFSVSVVGSSIIHASPRTVYFLYSDPEFLTVNEAFSIVGGATVYGLCKCPQHQGFNTTRNWVLESGKINYTELGDGIVVLFGNPTYNVVVKYYEDAGLTPVKFHKNLTHLMFLDKTGKILLSLSEESVENGSEDAFVLYVFKDGDNSFLVMYGFGWRGAWAAGIYFADVISRNLPEYSETYYVFHWTDEIQDGVPQISEIQEISLNVDPATE